MNVSVSLWTYVTLINNKEMSVSEVIRHMHKNGIQYVEVLDCFLPTDEAKQEALKTIKELKMKVSSYSIGNNFVCGEETRLAQVEKVKNACKYAKMFETNTIRVFCGDVREGYDFEKAFDLIVKSFKECVKVAEKEDIYYCLENHGQLAGKSKQVEAVIKAVGSKHLKATTDTGNFMLVGENSLDAVKYLKDYIGLVHFKDFHLVSKEEAQYIGNNNTIFAKGAIIGEGDTPMQAIVDFLDSIHYPGCISIEYEGEIRLDYIEQSIKNTLGFLR